MNATLPPALASILNEADAFTTEAPMPLPGQWRFWVDRSVAPYQPLGPVQPTAFTCTKQLSGYGAGQISLDVSNPSLTATDLLTFWAWRLWVYYDGAPFWCGCPTGLIDVAGPTVSLTLTELTGYLTERQLDSAPSYTQTEQTTIARALAAPVTDVGVSIVTDPGPGFRRDRQYEYLEGAHRGELLTNLSNVLDGPEFRAEYSIDPDTARPVCALRIAYPRIGSRGSDLGLTVPGSAIDYEGTWDADQLRTRTFAVGTLPENAAPDAKAPVVVVDRPQPLLPRLDRVDDWDGVILVSTLTERANTNASIYATPALSVRGSTFETAPPLGSYGLGDDVSVTVRDPFLPDGYNTTGRLSGIEIDAATGVVTWTVAMTQPPAKPRARLTARLANAQRAISAMLHKNVGEIG